MCKKIGVIKKYSIETEWIIINQNKRCKFALFLLFVVFERKVKITSNEKFKLLGEYMVNYLRKTWLALSLILLCTGVHAAIYNGTSGGTNWTLDTDTGVLTISKGTTGVTSDYCGTWEDYCGWSRNENPWEREYTGIRYTNYKRYITSIVVEEGVTELGTALFHGLSNVTSVKLPESLTTIGYEAFRGCSKLDSIYIPKNVCTLKDRWATECYELSVIEVDPENQCYFVDQYGAVYDADTTTLVKLPQDMTIGELVIPEGVTEFATGDCLTSLFSRPLFVIVL